MERRTLKRLAFYALIIFVLVAIDATSGGLLAPLDSSLYISISAVPYTWFTSALIHMTNAFNTAYFLTAGLLFLAYVSARGREDLVPATIISVIGVMVTYSLLKFVFQIERPLAQYIETGGYSFPSGHSTLVAFLFVLFIHYLRTYYKKDTMLQIIAGGLASLVVLGVAFSRLYLGVHWLSDVLAGLALGTSIGSASILIHQAIQRSRMNMFSRFFKKRKRL